jgi:acetyltransferase
MNNLKNFINPKTIAVVGASNNPDKVGGILMKKLSKFKGKVIPINPKHKKILNKKSYSSLLKYPENIDLVIIVVSAPLVEKILNECGEKKIKNVIVISAGFSEIKNFKLEEKIKEVAKKYNINLLGPNCFGIANPYLNLDATFSMTSSKKGDIAFLSQSGALWSYISDFKNIGFSGFVSLGNMADLSFVDFIKYFNEDEKTKTIILYIEKLKKGKEFIELCKKVKKEIIVIKAGKTKKGGEATISHTGSLAVDYEIYKGAFKQAKVKSANSLMSAINYSKLKIKPKGKRVLILTNAGGAGALAVDYCIKNKLEVVNHPIDLLGTAQSNDYKKALNKLKNKKHYDSILVILTPQKMSELKKVAQVICEFAKTKPVIPCFLGQESIKDSKNIFKKNNVLFFNDLENAVGVLGVC